VASAHLPHGSGAASAAPAGTDSEFNPSPEAEAEPAGDFCPRCKSKLIDPNGLGWCKACGYCKSLEDDKARVPLEAQRLPRPPSTLGLVEFGQVMAQLPSWVWIMLGGVAIVVAFSVPLAGSLAARPLPRAVCSTVEAILGLLLIFAAQTWALCVLAPGDDKLHFKDAVFPGRLWGMSLRRLPQMRGQVWLASWGLACILSAVFVIGGQAHWLTYLPKKATPPPAVEQPE